MAFMLELNVRKEGAFFSLTYRELVCEFRNRGVLDYARGER